MIHGWATAKKDIENVCKQGAGGVITAYLPEMEIFAISFDGKVPGGKWIKFEMSEAEFLELFEVDIPKTSENG